MNYITDDDITEFLTFILLEEKRIYNENPMPSAEETNRKRKDFRTKVEEITRKVAEREGITIEN